MLWENIIPKKFSDYIVNNHSVNILKLLSESIKCKKGPFPNIILSGINHTGKYTLSKCFLQNIYGDEIYNTKIIPFKFKQNCSNYEILIEKSKYHYETSFYGLQFADRNVMIALFNEFFSTKDLITNTHKVLLIKNFETLTEPAQLALRRIVEQNVFSVRLILLVKNQVNINKAILSRFIVIRCPRFNKDELLLILKYTCNQKKIIINQDKLNNIINISENKIGLCNSYLYLYKYNTNPSLENPKYILIDKLLEYLTKDTFYQNEIKDFISKLQLSKISHRDIFNRILQKSYKTLDVNNIFKIIDIIAESDYILQRINKYSIIVEKIMISIYIIYNSTN